MSTDFSSNTIILDDTAKTDFKNSEDLSEASLFSCLKLADEKSSGKYDRSTINEVYNGSRNGWAIEAVEQLCKMAEVKGLEFLYSGTEISFHWKFPLGKSFTYAYAYLLDKPQLELAVAAIDQVFAWARQNVDKLSTPDFLGYFAEATDIQEAIEEATPSLAPRQDCEVAYSDDGDGPWYLFSLLISIQQVMRNALKFNKRVLHTVELPE